MDEEIKQLRAKAKHLEPIVQIGKNKLSPGTIELVERELMQRQLIKIKFLKAALPEDATKKDRQELAASIATVTKSAIVEQVGNILVLYKSSKAF